MKKIAIHDALVHNHSTFVGKGEKRLYCIIPFCHLILASNGVKCCTWLYEKEGCNYVSLEKNGNLNDIWQDDALQRVRESIRDGSYTHCQLANCPEVRGERQYLLSLAVIKEKYPAVADFLERKTEKYIAQPDFVNISNDLSCNLHCPSCCRHLLPDFHYTVKLNFLEALKIFGNSLKTIFLAGMGEPFFSPVYMNWIKQFQSGNFPALEKIMINTNAQMLTDKLWAKLPDDFRSRIKMIITSIDGARAVTYEKNRPGGSFKTLLKNLSLLRELRESKQINCLKLYYVYQRNNYKDIPEMLQIAKQFLFDKIFFARLSNWGSYTHPVYKKLDVGNPCHPQYKALTKIKDLIGDYKRENSKPDITFMT